MKTNEKQIQSDEEKETAIADRHASIVTEACSVRQHNRFWYVRSGIEREKIFLHCSIIRYIVGRSTLGCYQNQLASTCEASADHLIVLFVDDHLWIRILHINLPLLMYHVVPKIHIIATANQKVIQTTSQDERKITRDGTRRSLFRTVGLIQCSLEEQLVWCSTQWLSTPDTRWRRYCNLEGAISASTVSGNDREGPSSCRFNQIPTQTVFPVSRFVIWMLYVEWAVATTLLGTHRKLESLPVGSIRNCDCRSTTTIVIGKRNYVFLDLFSAYFHLICTLWNDFNSDTNSNFRRSRFTYLPSA